MKYLILVGDGMADFPLAEFGNKTPLTVAKTPAMDRIALEGICGLFCPIPEGYAPGSDIGNLSLFGYDPASTFTGRAPLEAANQGIHLSSNELAFRCNLVTLQDGLMEDFTAGHITSQEAGQLISHLDTGFADTPVTFHPGVSYRHLAIVQSDPAGLAHLAALKCTPPHDIIQQDSRLHLPKGEGNGPILSMMARAQDLLDGHSVNKARRARDLPPANAIWLWGQGPAPQIEPYSEKFGLQGAVISAVDLVNGIGRCAGFEVVHVPGATGYLDTDYEGKVSAAFEALERVDFVYLHVEAPDEASHEGDASLKVRAIEDFDARVVAPSVERAAALGNCRILVAPDHITAIATRTHAAGPVPFAVCGPGVEPDGRSCYCESEAAASGVLFPEGHALVQAFLRSDTLANPHG